MEVQREDPAGEIRQLRHCINDLVSILGLSAISTGGDPPRIISTLLESLLGMLHLDFAYARLSGSAQETPIVMLRVSSQWETARQPHEICEDLRRLGDDPQKWPPAVPNLLGEGDISMLGLRLGLQGEIGLLVAGAQRLNFPEKTERLVLNVAANQAAIGLHEARLLNEQKRLASELDERVAQRTRELAEANEELKSAKAALQEAFDEIKKSEAKLRQVIDTIPALAWCNLPDGPNEFLNKGWHGYTGLSPEESHGWGWLVAFHPDDLPPLMERWREMLVSGEPGEIEVRLRRYDGVYRWFLIRAEPLRDEGGRIVRWYGTSTDIDDRKRAEEKLRRSEEFLAEGQRISLTGSFSWRVGSDEITWSEQLYRIYEFEIGVPVTLELIRTRVHPDDLTLFEKMVEQARCGGNDFEWQYRLVMPNHSIKYLHAVAHATRDRDGQLEYVAVVQDVTERRLAEEALGKFRSQLSHVSRVATLAALTASIAHEVNQPLSGIITNASTCLRMLSADPPNVDGARETARRTIRDGNRVSDVIARLRTLYSKKELSPEPMDLNEAVREITSLSLRELQANWVILQHELADDLPPVTGDRVQLQQVVLNLLRNASEAMSAVDDRPRELIVRTERDNGNRVRVSVKDAGVGLAAQPADRLFEAFYTTKTDGMGMGLSISRAIIEAHRGRLWATANDGPGATFSFSIPCRQDIPIIFITGQRYGTIRPQVIEQGAVDCLFKPFSDTALHEALKAALKKK